MTRVVVGFRKFTSKKGVNMAVIHCECSDFSETEKSSGEFAGVKTENVMVFNPDDVNKIDKSCVGKELLGFFGYTSAGTSVQSPAFK